MKTRKNRINDELRPEYDLGQLLKGGVRGKYAKRYHAGTNLVLFDPDVRKAFRSRGTACRPLRVRCRRTRKGRASPTPTCGLVIELRRVGRYKRRDYSSNGA
jgi:hypothetical protein